MIKEKMIGNRVIVENGKAKTILNEETQLKGWMTVDECFRLVRNGIVKIDKSIKDESSH